MCSLAVPFTVAAIFFTKKFMNKILNPSIIMKMETSAEYIYMINFFSILICLSLNIFPFYGEIVCCPLLNLIFKFIEQANAATTRSSSLLIKSLCA